MKKNFFPGSAERLLDFGVHVAGPFKAGIGLMMFLLMSLVLFAGGPKPTPPASSPGSCPPANFINGLPGTSGNEAWTYYLGDLVNYPHQAYATDPFQAIGLDNQWTSGSQDDDLNPSVDWKWVFGNSNDKGDIANAGILRCNDLLYFFGDRASYSGDAQIGLWLFVDDVYPTGTGRRASPFNGQHSDGDLLIISNFVNGGGISVPNVYVWRSGAPVLVCSSGACPPLGLIATNSSNVTSPWPFQAKGSNVPNTYLPNLFCEGYVDLSLISSTIGFPVNQQCYQRFLLETRNSQSLTASLQDFVAGDFSGLPAPPVITSDTICAGSTDAALVASCTGSGVINWYATATSTVPIFTGSTFNPSGSASFAPGTYTYYATCTEGICESPRVSASLTVFSLPVGVVTADAGGPLPICSVGYPYQLGVTVDAILNNPNYTYTWSANPSSGTSFSCNPCANPTFSASTPGTYVLTVDIVPVSGYPSCSTQAQFTVTVSSCGGHIFPTNTTCCNYLGGPTLTFDLEQVCTTVSGSRISNAIPGVFFYYGTYSATSSGPVTLTVQQTRSCPSNILRPFDPQNNSNVRVYVDNCVTVSPSGVSINSGNASITFNAVAGKTYVISVKYDTKSILNSTAPSGPVTYTFAMYQSSTLVPNSAGSLNVVQGCSDNTPLASGSCPSPRGIITVEQPLVSDLSVSAYPNPYLTSVTFKIISPESGNAVLEIFDASGARLTTIIKRDIRAGFAEQIKYRVPSNVLSNLYYRVTVNDKSVRGTVISGR